MSTKYRIVGTSRFSDFEKAVNDALAEGWQLQGGVSVANETAHTPDYWAQAMVKHEPEPKPIEPERNYFIAGNPDQLYTLPELWANIRPGDAIMWR